MAGTRALPDLKSRLVIDTSSLKTAELQATAAGNSMSVGLGKGSSATKLLQKDLQGLQRDTAKAIPGLGGMGNSMMGLPAPALAGAAAIGILAIAGKSMIEISDKWSASQRGLKQATDSAGASFEDAQTEVEAFIKTNRRFVSDRAEVADSFAALTRELGANGRVTEDLNLALDLSAIKHIKLADATTLLQQVEMGRGRALLPLGINMKEYPVLTESALQATKKLEAAEKAVAVATAAHTDAIHKHGIKSQQARDAAIKLAEANAKLAEAHNYAKERAAASAEIHDLLHKKLDGGRKTTSDMTQAQNQLGNTWQEISEKTGPKLVTALGFVLNVFNGILDAIGNVIGAIASLIDWISKIDVRKIPVIGGLVGAASTALGSNPGFTGTGGRGGHRAFGGTVLPNSIYTVGERGPETLVMGQQGGTVIPHSGGSLSGNVTVNVQGFVGNPQELFKVFREGIRRLDRAQAT